MQVIGINLRESPETVRSRFIEPFGLTYPIWLDRIGSAWSYFGMGYIPHNVVISPDSVVRYTNYGYRKEEIIQTIEQWLPTGVQQENSELPSRFALLPPHPNPYRPGAGELLVEIQARERTVARVEILDLRGRVVRTLWRNQVGPGATTLRWNGTDGSGQPMASGIYLVRATLGGGQTLQRKVLLLR